VNRIFHGARGALGRAAAAWIATRPRPRFGLALAALLAVGMALALAIGSGDGNGNDPSAEAHAAPGAALGASHPVARGIPIIDVHVHSSAESVSRLEGLMTRYGVSRVVNLSGGHPLAGLDEQLAARARLVRATGCRRWRLAQHRQPGRQPDGL